MRWNPRTWWVGVGGVVVVIVLGATAVTVWKHMVRTRPGIARLTNNPIPVSVVQAGIREVTDIVGGTGTVQPVEILNLTARVAVRVEKVPVEVGQLVKTNETLVQFERNVLQAAAEAAEAARDEAAANQRRAQLHFTRIKAIVDQGLLPKVDLDRAEADLDRARAAHSDARQRVERARQDLAYATLVSPVTAIVMERTVNPGETPNVNVPLLTLGRIEQVLIETRIPEEKTGDVHVGQPATVTFNAFPNEVMQGVVSKLKPVTDQETRTFLVYVRLANPELKLKPGLTGFTRLQTTRPAVSVPSVALVNPTGLRESYVFVVGDDAVARLRRVRLGASGDGMTLVREGLQPGDKVVTVGHLYLREGDSVRVGVEFTTVRAQADRPASVRGRVTP